LNPHAAQPTSLFSLGKSIWTNRHLIQKLAWREVVERYKGSVLGLFWSFINPVLMLIVYTFVFSVVFQAKWGVGDAENKTSFALILFAGLILHGFLAEVFNRAPNLILNNANYVKKVVFPLELLPIICLASASFNGAISITVLLIASVIVNGYLPWTVMFIPLVILPLGTLVLGCAWILAALGVFVRDVSQTIGIITTVMLFMAPVFFPLSAMPEKFHPFILANPLTFIIEQAREVLIFGRQPNWSGLAVYMLIAFGVAWLGYVWFQKTRKGFADVL
jgi:lipopolysaccharide transport system permease protein